MGGRMERNMKNRKKIALVLAVLMLISSLGGCSSNNNNKKEDKLNTITILYPGDESERMSEFLGNEFAEKMATDLKLKVEVVYVPWDQYWEQKDIMLAANEPIDLYWDGLPSLSTMVNKKQARVLNDLIEEYGQDMLKVLPKEQLEGAAIKGEIYGIPSAYAPSSAMYQLVCARQDIMDAVGMKDINTAEDLKEFAKRTKEQLPELKGPSDIIFKPLTRYFQEEQLTWIAVEDLIVYGENTNKVYSYYETEAFKKVAQFNREMYLAGYYADDLTIKYNERDSRMQTGQYTWVEGSLGKENEIIGTVRTNAPQAQLKSYLLSAEKPRYITSTGGEVLCIPQTAPNPEGAMKFVNWLYASKDNYLFALYGVEGKDYEIVDGRINKLSNNDFFYEWMFRNQNYQMFSPETDQAYIDMYSTWDDNAIRSKTIGFNFNNEKVKVIETAIKEIGMKDLAAIRTGFVDFDTEYPKAIEKLKAAGIDEYVAEVQRQFDEFIAAQSK